VITKMRMKPEQFHRAIRLHGKSVLVAAHDIGINRSTVSAYASGKYPVPKHVRQKVVRMLRARRQEIDDFLNSLSAIR
jgi:predicted transcriptional regulator